MRRLYPLPVCQRSALPPASSGPPVTQGALAVQLALPLAGRAEDFHLQERAPCRAHKRERAANLKPAAFPCFKGSLPL